ncbi:hypothetical protein [Brevibacillus sp. SAFN-007a]|uniref:hypothetical protein n=1 Tax=Brevibacillus sp. SAFN-007a TaxID=3436862 RepID=UPI003F7E7227
MGKKLSKPKYDVTRYLCAAAELDRKFRSTVFEHVVHNSYRFVAKSYGVDLPRVVRQCLRAQTRDLVVDSLFCLILIVFLVKHFSKYGLVYGIIGFIPAFLAWPFFYSFLVTIGSKLYSEWLVTKQLSRNRFHKAGEASSFVEKMNEQRLKELEELEAGNAIYYSGYSPFVGAGQRLGGWSFVFRTQNARNRENYVDISLPHLYAFLEQKLHNLNIKDMSVNDGLFIDGKTLNMYPEFLTRDGSAPLLNVSDDMIEESMKTFSEQRRFYKVVQVTGWQGNFIFSTFFRLVKNNRQMFLEVSYYLLPPLKEEYYKIDQMSSTIKASKIGKAFIRSIIPALLNPFRSPVRLISQVNLLISKGRTANQESKEREENPQFDYGAIESIREMVACNNLQNYFQEADVDMYRKQIERHLMDAMTEYFIDHDVDVSEFNSRKETVLQQGIVINGGNIQVENMVNGNQFFQKVSENIKEAVKS